jgi:hypothetical protein
MRFISLLILAVTCASCASAPKTVPVPKAAPPLTGALIIRLVGRHDVLIVRAGQRGPTYSWVSNDGSVRTPDLTLEDMAVSNPGLFRSIKTMETNVSWAGL